MGLQFLDGSRIAQLAIYLEHVHKLGSAIPQHTTILLNCYSKMQARDKIDRFVADTSHTFDVETGIKAGRGA